jgi:Ras-related protein Rab-1A
MNDEYAHLFKVLVVGSSGVGKTCLLLRYTDSVYKESYSSTIGVDFKMKSVNVDGVPIKLQIWDTAGQERFRTITSSYYRNAHGIMLVFDITDRDTFRDLRGWMNEIKSNTNTPVTILIVGNKVDEVDREKRAPEHVGREDVDEFMKNYQDNKRITIRGYYEVSAKEDVRVSESFGEIARAIKETYKERGGTGTSVRLDPDEAVSRGMCCQ